jgi:NTE family protein
MSEAPTRIAVVLAGAVAKGAFEAGALHALAHRNIQIVRIVATSSGALNGALLASGVRTRSLPATAERLVELWRDRAGWSDVFHASFRAVTSRQGVSDRTRVLELLRREIRPSPQGDDVALRLLVSPLAGTTGVIGDHPATTYEAMLEFFGVDFATQPALERVFDAATASSAFPLVFAPVELGALGPCVDGGAVNNTPVKWALDGTEDDHIDAVVVVATSPELRTTPPTELHGVGLALHLANMLIGERLYRDLHEAEDINERLHALDALVARGVLTQIQLDQVLAAIGWQGWRRVKLLQIRPLEELPGSSFSGFFDEHLREQYIADGIARARAVLDIQLATAAPLRE